MRFLAKLGIVLGVFALFTFLTNLFFKLLGMLPIGFPFSIDSNWCNSCTDQILGGKTVHMCTLLACSPRPLWAIVVNSAVFVIILLSLTWIFSRLLFRYIWPKNKER